MRPGNGYRTRHPTFLWQGVLILLPVVVLALVSVASLRQDERAAEADARKRAAENVQSLALAVRDRVDGELTRYFNLQNIWMREVRAESQPYDRLEFPDPKLKTDLAQWDRDYPGLRVADLALPSASVLTNGQMIEPPGIPPVPVPPQWFLELSSPQRSLWEALRSAAPPAEFEKCKQRFFDSKPSAHARQTVFYLGHPPAEIVDLSPQPSETGLSFQEVACCQLLTATNAQLSPALLNSVWHLTIDESSFIAPKLLELARRLAATADPGIRQKYEWAVYLKHRQNQVIEDLASIRHQPGWQLGKPAWWSHWTDHDQMLATFLPRTFASERTTNYSGEGYEVRFTPREVVEAVFTRALRENQFLIPDYATVSLAFEGVPLPTDFPAAGNDDVLLATADPKVRDYYTEDKIPFHLSFYLASREQMLSAERHRARLSTLLILCTVGVALAGWLTARRAFQRQLQLNELKSNFVSSVSHELRAPIASVRLMAENLEGGKIPSADKRQEYYRFIVQECRRLSSLIENVLDFSRIEQGRKQYEFEPTDLLALTQTTVRLLEPYAGEKGVTLELATPTGDATPKLELNLDGRAIQQALVNLLDNAIKHSAKGQTVTIGMERKNELPTLSALLWVADQGPGIPRAEQEKIFERFYRRGSELRRETQGIGIGLSLVKHIVEAHDGRVLVVSEPGEGSRFTIELPITGRV